jgi:putative pre-16S rRNA nuclease
VSASGGDAPRAGGGDAPRDGAARAAPRPGAQQGRVVALDYGSARCGVAVSDPTGTLATPLDPVFRPNTRKGFNRLLAAVRAYEPERVVVGLPLSLSGRDSAQTTEARGFAERLGTALQIPVEMHDERFTTTLAQRRPGTAAEDSRAAAVLLEDWLAHRS